MSNTLLSVVLRLPRTTLVPALMRELHWHHCRTEEPGFTTGNPPEDYRQTGGGCSVPWMIAVKHATDGTDPCDPPGMGAKSTTTRNHPGTPN